MKDRMMIGMMVLTLAICAAVGFFAWRMMQQGQQVNQAILAKLETLVQPTTQPAVAADWAKVTFRCYDRFDQQGKSERKPADTLTINLMGHAFNDAQEDTITQNTDNEGLTTFGPVRPGQYTWSIRPGGYEEQRGSVALYPGTIGEQVIDIPARLKQTWVAVRANWPADLKQRDVLLYARFKPEDMQLGDRSWTAWTEDVTIAPGGAVRATGTMRSFSVSETLWLASSAVASLGAGMGGMGGMMMGAGGNPDRAGSGGGYGGFGGGYGGSLPAAAAPSPFVSRVYRQPVSRIALFYHDLEVGSMGSTYKQATIAVRPSRHHLESLCVMCRASDPNGEGLQWIQCAKVDYEQATQRPTFDAQYGKENTWTIDLPEEVVKQARENLPRCQEPLDMLTDIELRVAWPEDLAGKQFPLLCKFVPATAPPEKVFQNQYWSINEWTPFVRADGYLVWGYGYVPIPRRPSPIADRRAGTREPDLNVIAPEGVELKEEQRTRRPATTYWLTAISVLAPTEDAGNPQVRWHLIAAKGFHNSAEPLVLVAGKGKLNTWTITLPEDLLTQVREYVAKESMPASQPLS